MKYEEYKIQVSFVKWVQLQYPKFRDFIFHVPNGGKMSLIKGSRLKSLGVKPGVADILFMFRTNNFGGLWLEFKTPKGVQSLEQKKFEQLSKIAQYDYKIVRSIEEAIDVFKKYVENING